MPPRARYRPPREIRTVGLWSLLCGVRTVSPRQHHHSFLPGMGPTVEPESGPTLWYSGDLSLVRQPCVAVVGARRASPAGRLRAAEVARALAQRGIVVVSGLAEGIDVTAHESAIAAGGRTIAVIGTPIDRAYPAAHAGLQEQIYTDHLLISSFAPGARVFASNFPQRNRLMAAISDATVIIEAGESSGTLHQASECRSDRLNRWLFIDRSQVGRSDLAWPSTFLGHPRVQILDDPADIRIVWQ